MWRPQLAFKFPNTEILCLLPWKTSVLYLEKLNIFRSNCRNSTKFLVGTNILFVKTLSSG